MLLTVNGSVMNITVAPLAVAIGSLRVITAFIATPHSLTLFSRILAEYLNVADGGPLAPFHRIVPVFSYDSIRSASIVAFFLHVSILCATQIAALAGVLCGLFHLRIA